MKLSKALTTLKDLKSKISAARKFVTQSVIHYAEDTPEYDYKKELDNYLELDDQIIRLKANIQKTNILTKVEYLGSECTLAELILINAKIRSDLNLYQELLGHKINRSRSLLSGEEPKQVYAKDYDKLQIRAIIEKLESAKLELEGVMASANLRTDLVES